MPVSLQQTLPDSFYLTSTTQWKQEMMKYIYYHHMCSHMLTCYQHFLILDLVLETFSELTCSMIWNDQMIIEFGEVLDKVSDNQNSIGQLCTK